MLESLVRASVERRGLVLVITACILVASLLSARRLSVDAVADVTNVQVAILTASPGLSPLEVEQYITHPIETAMNGLPAVTEIRSVSRTAVSAITVIFDDSVSVWFARQLVAERLKLAEADIPKGYGDPELAPVSTGLGEIFEFYLASEGNKHSPMELRTLLDWEVARRLRSVPGVIEVNAMGGEAKQYQVRLSPQKMAAYRLTLGEVIQALERNNASIGGGYIEKNSEALVIRGEGQYKDLADIGSTVVTTDEHGTPVPLRMVAETVLGPALRFGVVTKAGQGEIVAGTVMMLIGQNSREVVNRVKAKLAEVQKELPSDVKIVPYYDRAEFIARMLKTVFTNLAEGALLVVLVLFLTLGTFRGSLIAALAIPLSMGLAVLGMVRLGIVGNLMSLGAIDFGLLVDGAIVLLEGTVVALAIAPRGPNGQVDVPEVVARTMGQSARPVAFSVAIILLVYLPMMALEGVEGRMFRPMAITVALALAGALIFSLVVFPALAAYVLKPPAPAKSDKKDKKNDTQGESDGAASDSAAAHAEKNAPAAHADPHAAHGTGGVFGWLRVRYGSLLDRALAHRRLVLLGCLPVLALTIGLAMALGAEFVPRLDEGELSLDVRHIPSISLEASKRLGTQVEQVVSKFPEVRSVVTRIGRPEVATDPVGFDETAVRVKLKEKDEWTSAHDLDALGDALKTAIEREVPATFVSVSQPIEDRVNQLLSGSRADVAVKVFGPDLLVAKGLADRIGATMAKVSGTGDLRVQRVLGLPLLDIKVDRRRLARYDIPTDEVLSLVEASRVGRKVGKVFEGPRRFDLTLLMPPQTLTTEGFGNLLVGTQAGQLVPLAQVADLRETEGPAVINREGLERRVLVEVNTRGRDLVSYVNEARARVEREVKVPAGYHLTWGGQFENFTRAKDRLLLVVPVALGIIFGMLYLMFGGVGYALAVFACVPLGLLGGVVALLIRGLPFSIPAAVGFIALGGVAVLNGVVMASTLRRLLDEGHSPVEAVREAALSSLRPILTTALVAALGFLPMAISTRAGAEMQRPLATVVIGGILSSTLLMLVVLPALLQWLSARAASKAEKTAAKTEKAELVQPGEGSGKVVA